MYSVKLLRTEMTLDPSNCHREAHLKARILDFILKGMTAFHALINSERVQACVL